MELCTSILWLHEGEMRMMGTPQEVIPAYEEFMS
jgi:ABC-type polysaccharide/polyol phosphate transport system ATPase subunit